MTYYFQRENLARQLSISQQTCEISSIQNQGPRVNNKVGPDNATMERIKTISAMQNELSDRILTQYLQPMKADIRKKEWSGQKATLAEQARVYKLEKLLDTLSQSCQINKKLMFWYGTIGKHMAPNFANLMQKKVDEMEQVCIYGYFLLPLFSYLVVNVVGICTRV